MTKTTFTLFATLLILSTLIEGTYKAGVFYRNHLHDYVVEYSLKAFALVITLMTYFIQGVQYLYNEREKIWFHIEDAFVYKSPQVSL